MKTGSGSVYDFEGFRLDPDRRLLFRNNQPVPLTPKVFEILLLLVESSDKVVRKEELMNALWPDKFVEEANLTQNIFVLRKALGETSQDHRYILTVPGTGYRFAAPVKKVHPAQGEEQQDPGANQPSTRSLISPKTRRPSDVVLVLAVVTVIAAVAIYVIRYSVHRSPRVHAQVMPVTRPQRRSVVILGFENLSGRQQDAWLSTAFSEMLSTELAAGERVHVTDSEDPSQPRQQLESIDLRLLAKDKLGTFSHNVASDLVVSGSYAVVANEPAPQLRLDIRVQDTRSGELLTQMAETAPETNLFELVSRLGTRLRQRLQISDLSPTEAAVVRASMPDSTQAMELYSEGLQKLRVFDALGARERLLRAIAVDRKYPLAHAALADAWSVLGYDQKAKAEAGDAFRLSAHLSREDRLQVEGRYQTALRNWTKAIEAYQTLFTLFPDNIDYGLRLAAAQSSASKPSEALATLQILRKLAPPAGEDPRIDLEESRAWNSLGDFNRMEIALATAADRARERQAQLLLARARNQQCFVFRFLAKQAEAINACLEAQRIYDAEGDRGGIADTLRVMGDALSGSDPDRAIAIYKKSLAINRAIGHLRGQAIVLNELAIQYSIRGDHSRAKGLFQQTYNIFREVGNEFSANSILINVGYELQAQGKLNDSLHMYENVISAARAIGNKDVEGIGECNVGVVQQLQGDLPTAKRTLEQALLLLQTVGDRSVSASAMNSLGQVLAAQGNFADAQKYQEQALAIREEGRENVPAAETQVDITELSFEQGHSGAELELPLRHAIDVFHADRNVNDEVRAETLLARILASQMRSADALAAVNQAVLMMPKADPSYRLAAAVEIGHVRTAFARDTGSKRQVIATLKSTAAEARKFGFGGIELQAKLTLAEAELSQSNRPAARARIERVRNDAQSKGFTVIANKASTLMDSLAQQATVAQSGHTLR